MFDVCAFLPNTRFLFYLCNKMGTNNAIIQVQTIKMLMTKLYCILASDLAKTPCSWFVLFRGGHEPDADLCREPHFGARRTSLAPAPRLPPAGHRAHAQAADPHRQGSGRRGFDSYPLAEGEQHCNAARA